MRLGPRFILRIAKAAKPPYEEPRMTSIIILRPHAHLQEELHKTFKGEKDVKVIVDRRYGERRTSRKPVVKERRRSDQRRAKEHLVEVVISA